MSRYRGRTRKVDETFRQYKTYDVANPKHKDKSLGWYRTCDITTTSYEHLVCLMQRNIQHPRTSAPANLMLSTSEDPSFAEAVFERGAAVTS